MVVYHLKCARFESNSMANWDHARSTLEIQCKSLGRLGDEENELKWCLRVLAQITATIVKPRDDRPYEGFLLINSEISPMASSLYEAGRCVSLRTNKGMSKLKV